MLHNGSSHIDEVFFALCKSIDTPFSLRAWIQFRDDPKGFSEIEIKPENYVDALTFRGDYLVASFLSKYKGLDTGNDLEAEALQRFSSSEVTCLETNNRLKHSRKVGYPPISRDIIPIARRKISQLLGPYSTFKVSEAYGWGPGATSDISRRRAFVDTKLSQIPISVTPKALPILRQEIGADLHWSAVILGTDPGSIMGPFCFLPHIFAVKSECVIDTVPKNSKTHRVIAKENTGNGFLQKGFGSYIRQRMKRVGIDLDDQTSNQEAAFAALDEGLATLDLKAASDTVAIELIYELFPIDWAFALDDVRSHKAVLPNGEVITLQKFSSMGNGFTFELESLIFWAISSSVSDVYSDSDRVWIYGDDIVCSKRCAVELIEVLGYCGFEVNSSKSFVSGLFYESCGKHYFDRYDVTPIYQKELLHDEEIIRCANRLIRCAHRFGSFDTLFKGIFAAWARVWRLGAAFHRFQLPLGAEGDDGFVVPASYFTAVAQDLNLGLRCRVIDRKSVV